MQNRYIFSARISERKFKELLTLFCADIPALSASDLTLINPKTSQRIYEGLRKRVVELATEEARPFTGGVKIEESYFGPRRVRGRRGRGAGAKPRSSAGSNAAAKCSPAWSQTVPVQSTEPIIKGQVLSKATVYTDGWLGYDGLLLCGCKHHRLHHHENEFARGKNHVNGIESFWSFAKFRFVKRRGVRRKYFLLPLQESEWRWNHRRDHLRSILLKNLRLKPL